MWLNCTYETTSISKRGCWFLVVVVDVRDRREVLPQRPQVGLRGRLRVGDHVAELDGLLSTWVPGLLPLLDLPRPLDAHVPAQVGPADWEVDEVAALHALKKNKI